jgi:hypothetical protein
LHILLIYWPIYAKFCENIVRLINNLCGKLTFHWIQWTDVSKIEDSDPLHKDLKVLEIELIYFFSSLGTQYYGDQNHKTSCEHSFFSDFLR